MFSYSKNSLISSFKATVLPLIFLTSLALAGCLGFYYLEQEVKNTFADELKLILNTNVNALKQRIELRRSEVRGWAHYNDVRQEILALIALSKSSNSRETLLKSKELARLRERLEPVCKEHGFIGFVVFDHSGMPIGSLLDEIIGDEELIEKSSDFVARSLSGETVVSLPFLSDIPQAKKMKANQPTQFVSSPIYDNSGIVTGVLAFRLNPKVEFSQTLETSQWKGTGETYAFDARGLMLSDSRFNDQLRSAGVLPNQPDSHAILSVHLWVPELKSSPKSLETNSLPRLTRMAASATRGETGFDSNGYRDYRGVLVLGAWTWLSEYGFGVASEIDFAEILDSLHFLWKMFLVFLIISILAILYSIVLVFRQRQLETMHQSTNQLIVALKQAQSKYLTETSFDSVFSELLDKVLGLTESMYGFIAELLFKDDGKPYIKSLARTNISWNVETRELYNKYAKSGLEFYNMETLFGAVVTSGKPVISHDPESDPRSMSGGVPNGHPILNSFLGLPIHYGSNMIGVIGLANRQGGYDENMVEHLRPLVETCANLIQASRTEKQRKSAEELLQKNNESLEIRVQNRTSELLAANAQLRKLSRAAEQSPSSIIITDVKGNIEYVNPKFTQLSGYTLEEVVGKNPKILKSGNKSAEEYRSLWETITSGQEWRGEFLNRKKDGTRYWGSAAISGVKDSLGNITHYISSMEDITEKHIYQEKIESALREKEILMKEINHRAKNNMQIISSLIRMQSRDACDEPKLTALLRNIRNRISAMSLVHDQIFGSNDLSKIDTNRYTTDLANNVRSSFGQIAEKVQLKIETNGIILNVDKCIHCGLIINELITNSLKYAFPAGQEGLIGISLRTLENGMLELAVHDNGVGICEDIDIHNASSLGMRLVTTLAENQLRGKIELTRNYGTEFKVVFPG